MVNSENVKFWIMEVVVRFSKVKQFVESTNYVYFTDWYRDALEDLGNTEGGESTQGGLNCYKRSGINLLLVRMISNGRVRQNLLMTIKII